MKTLKTFMGKGGLILVLVLAITNSVSAFAAQGTTTAAMVAPGMPKRLMQMETGYGPGQQKTERHIP